MAGLLPVAEALGRILDGIQPTEPETVPIADADGRVLADDVTALLTQPPFDASAMDGYAARAADVTSLPATLSMIGEAAAGRRFGGRVGPGECVRIFTGAPVPDGADAIVIQENTSAEGARVTVRDGTCDPAHIRRRGGDFTTGERLLETGRQLEAHALLLAAAAGLGALSVRRRPRIAILATGNELVPPGETPGPDQIVSSNPVALSALVRSAGGMPLPLGIARDDIAAIEERISAAAGADVIVTIGGASVGDHDLVAPALARQGMELDFWKIAMRPGKPMLFGRMAGRRVLGLPGNPVSTLVTGRVFLVPLVRALLGLPAIGERYGSAVLDHPLEANGPRQHYMRATLIRRQDRPPGVTALPDQDSSLMRPLAAADCLIVRAPHAPAAPTGTLVDILSFGL